MSLGKFEHFVKRLVISYGNNVHFMRPEKAKNIEN